MLLDLARELGALARTAGARLIVNDRADIAVLAGAAGVHVGQDDLTPRDVRTIAGDECVVGLSTHTDEQIEEAIASPISYFAIGPVFATGTKATGYDGVGLETVTRAAARGRDAGLPVVGDWRHHACHRAGGDRGRRRQRRGHHRFTHRKPGGARA